MAATGLQMNWTAVKHGEVEITHVNSVSFDAGGNNQGYAGDNDQYTRIVVNTMNAPTCTVTGADTAVIMGIAPGTDAAFTATHMDAKSATGGNIVYVLANAVSNGGQTSGDHGQFGTATVTFMGYAVDGITNPLSFTRT